jgi:pullulanase
MLIFNTSDKTQTFSYHFDSTSTQGYQLHPIQTKGSDEVVKQSKVTAEGFTVPPLSSVVFVKFNQDK